MLPPKLIVFCGALLAAVPARAQTVASWYGYPFHGRLAASGCVYDMWALTAASRTLPLGTVLEVTRAGRTVIVTVIDRGPYVAHRQLDLSYGAARRLDMIGVGVSPVVVRIIGYRPVRC